MGMRRTNFFYPDALLARLRLEKKRSGFPVSVIIRLAIIRYLDDAESRAAARPIELQES